jgi:hypothetical protein
VPVGGSIPIFPLHHEGRCDHTRPIVIYKLHGSLNWMVRINSLRPTANFLRQGGEGRDLQLVSKRQILGREAFVRRQGQGGRTRWVLWPIVVPPVYAKQALRSTAIQQIWADAREAMQSADRIVVFGYSLPSLDVEAEKVFERSLSANANTQWVDVVNPAALSAGRFASVSAARPVRWYPSLDHFLAEEAPSA